MEKLTYKEFIELIESRGFIIAKIEGNICVMNKDRTLLFMTIGVFERFVINTDYPCFSGTTTENQEMLYIAGNKLAITPLSERYLGTHEDRTSDEKMLNKLGITSKNENGEIKKMESIIDDLSEELEDK